VNFRMKRTGRLTARRLTPRWKPGRPVCSSGIENRDPDPGEEPLGMGDHTEVRDYALCVSPWPWRMPLPGDVDGRVWAAMRSSRVPRAWLAPGSQPAQPALRGWRGGDGILRAGVRGRLKMLAIRFKPEQGQLMNHFLPRDNLGREGTRRPKMRDPSSRKLRAARRNTCRLITDTVLATVVSRELAGA